MALGDDRTLDTVFYCSDCLTEVRYTFGGDPLNEQSDPNGPNGYAAFVEWARQDAIGTHLCVPRVAPTSRFTT